MIPLTFLYDEYIDRPKLTEQKKPRLKFLPPPPQVGLEQKFDLPSNQLLTNNPLTAAERMYSNSRINFIATILTLR